MSDDKSNSVREEHPQDRRMRLEGEEYGRKHAAEFLSEHSDEMAKLIGTYADARAEALLSDLRERFWSNDWLPKSLR